MEREENAREETSAELCRRADAEEDFETLLQLASKLQPLIEARWPRNKPVTQAMNREAPAVSAQLRKLVVVTASHD